MSREIILLDSHIIEKIAAGEVVERPAAVMKELVENAIDAGASEITVTIENAGLTLIRIADNGEGMMPENLDRAILRHATSKLKTIEDLYTLNTMGFRGEALASIASVSNMTLSSSATNDGLGASIRVEGGVVIEKLPIAHTRGTTIDVRDLFFNVPARKKFMKSDRSEKMALVRMLEEVACAFPGIRFIAFSDGKKSFDLPPVDTLRMRIGQIAGRELAQQLVECENEGDGIAVTLFVSQPPSVHAEAHARPRYQNLFVNLRRVESDTVNAAVRQSFGRFINEYYRPAFFCYIDIDPDKLDVNVHPTKRVIKFSDDKALFSLIYGAVKRSLTAFIAHNPLDQNGSGAAATIESSPFWSQSAFLQTREPQSVHRAPQSVQPQGNQEYQMGMAFTEQPHPFDKPLAELDPQTVQLTQSPITADESFSLISCYQIHETYILAPIKNGILLIDQHAAHERILYEQALRDISLGRGASQQLLFPLIVELSPSEKSVLDSGLAYFGKFGFDIKDFGQSTIAVSALPQFLKDSQAAGAIREMIGFLLEELDVRRMRDPNSRYAAAFACGAAIKAGQKLDREEMNGLVNTLFASENPYTCPHGRPTLVRLSMDELARRFLR